MVPISSGGADTAPLDRCMAALLHWWPLDAQRGASDAVGDASGVIHSDATAAYEKSAPASGPAAALRFDGRSTYVDIAGLSLRGAVSVSLWARVDGATLAQSYSYLFWFANDLKRQGSPGSNPFTDAAGFLALSPHFDSGVDSWALLNWRLDEQPKQAHVSGTQVAPATGWHHWLLTLDAFGAPSARTVARVYVDGSLAGWNDDFGTLDAAPRTHLYLGRSGNSNVDPLFAGAMADVRVIRGALRAEEAQELYRRRDGTCGAPLPAPNERPPGWEYVGCFIAANAEASATMYPRHLGSAVSSDECFARAAASSFTLAALVDVTRPPTSADATSGAWVVQDCYGGVAGESKYDALGAAECGPSADRLPGPAEQLVYRRVPPPPPGDHRPAVNITIVLIVAKCSITLCSLGSLVLACGQPLLKLLQDRRQARLDVARARLVSALADCEAAHERMHVAAVPVQDGGDVKQYEPPQVQGPQPSAPPIWHMPGACGAATGKQPAAAR